MGIALFYRVRRFGPGPLLRVVALGLWIAAVALLPAGSATRDPTAETEHLARVCTSVQGGAPPALAAYCAARGW